MSKKVIIIIVISLFCVLSILGIYFYLNPITGNKSNISTTSTPSTTKTLDTTVSYKANFVKDDKNSVSKLVLIDQNQKEIPIKKIKYSKTDNKTVKPVFKSFVFSKNYNFFYYQYTIGSAPSTSILYDIKNKKETDLGFDADVPIFTPDSKYFYACVGHKEMLLGGAVVIRLDSGKNLFSVPTDQYSTCQYDIPKSQMLFTQFDGNDKKKFVSQYVFSEKAGIVTQLN